MRLGDGWMHAGGTPEELDAMLERLTAIRKAEGKEDEPFEIHVGSAEAYTVDGVKRLEDKGVTDVTIAFRYAYALEQDTQPLEDKITALRRFSDEVVSRCS